MRRSMKANRGRDTQPELAVRRLLHAVGLRYRVNFRPIPRLNRTADVVFTRQKVAVFIDGCFWHGCPEHYQRPVSNREYWDPKVARNIARDLDTTRRLVSASWIVLRYWEHEAPEEVAKSIAACVKQRVG
ncbi:very short patch repair endonuclease [Agromyces seonyuensis]